MAHQRTFTGDDGMQRCPACRRTSHEDAWEVGGADPGYQFCPVCSREAMPINLYLESLGCEQEGRINHEGPFKAREEMDAWIAEEYGKRAVEQDAAYRLRTGQPKREEAQ